MSGIAEILSSSKNRMIGSALLSALTWGSWAFIANYESFSVALTAGSSQGVVSFITTLIGSFLLELLFNVLGASYRAMGLSVLIVSSISLLAMVCVHIAAHTPNIVLTILPVYIVVVSYCTFYLLGLRELEKESVS